MLVRHAQSLGNVANDRAHDEGLGRLELDTRDADTPLSEDGKTQARALGEHLTTMPEGERPQVILCSPYQRARETAQIALEQAGLDQRLVVDERLRERDLGVFDRLTRRGIEEEFPEEAERRTKEGKFYFRPAGGESWCDVALRVRSVLADIRAEYDDEQVWVFSHQAVIMAFRLVLEGMDEQTILKVDADGLLVVVAGVAAVVLIAAVVMGSGVPLPVTGLCAAVVGGCALGSPGLRGARHNPGNPAPPASGGPGPGGYGPSSRP